jgi:hypothetical protein
VRIHRKTYRYRVQLYLKVQRYLFGVDLPAVVKKQESQKTLEVQKVDVPRVFQQSFLEQVAKRDYSNFDENERHQTHWCQLRRQV